MPYRDVESQWSISAQAPAQSKGEKQVFKHRVLDLLHAGSGRVSSDQCFTSQAGTREEATDLNVKTNTSSSWRKRGVSAVTEV